MPEDKRDVPCILASLIPVLVVGIALVISVFIYDAEPHIALFIGAVAAGLTAYFNGYKWKTIKKGFTESISRAIPALIILLIIGMLIGSWIAGGIVPALIYIGFNIMHPSWFLPSVLIICAFMSVLTGSSWTTAGTIGVASIGVGHGLGIPAAAIAGAVVSGSFFGDKLSPMSDSTNLTPAVVGVDLYEHIKHMLYTTVPSFLIALVMYSVLGRFLAGGGTEMDVEEIARYQELIRENFVLSPLLAIPPVAILVKVFFKIPAIPSLVSGVVLAGIMQIAVQGDNIGDFFHVLYDGFTITSGWEEMDELLSRGGMSSMYSVVALGIISLGFGGIMNECGMLYSIVHTLAVIVKTTGNLVATTLATSIFINIFGANQYLSVIIPGQMYEEAYKRLHLHSKNLTRALEGGGTLTAPLVPWNSSGVFMMAALGVSPFVYAPYAFVCWLTAIIVAIYGYANITMEKEQD